MAELILEMRHITKRFGDVMANEDVNLQIEKGEVHALLGENGAGKSTLMNCLYGMYDSYEGEIYFEGKLVNIYDPKQAIQFESVWLRSAFYADSGSDCH